MLLKSLTSEELSNINLKPIGKQHFVRTAINNMTKGEALRISREAFTWKGQTPKRFCNEISKKSSKRFTVAREMSNTSWVVVRIA